MYSAVPIAANDLPAFTASARARRLNKNSNNIYLGVFYDLLFGAGPWVIGSAIAAVALTAIFVNVDGSADTFALFNAPVAIGAIATFASFLLVTYAPKPVPVVSVYHVSCPLRPSDRHHHLCSAVAREQTFQKTAPWWANSAICQAQSLMLPCF